MTTESRKEKIQWEKIGQIVSIGRRGKVWHYNLQDPFHLNTKGKPRQVRRSLGTTNKQAANKKALKIEEEVLAGEDPSYQPSPTVEQGINIYTTYLEVERRSRKTMTKYQAVFVNLRGICCDLGVGNMSQVNLRVMDAFRAKRAADGIGPKTLHVESMIVRQLVKHLYSREHIKVDPLRGLKLRCPKATKQPCLSPEEMAQVIAVSGEPARTFFLALRRLGVRANEAIHLMWSDVDFDAGFIHVRAKGWEERPTEGKPVKMTWRPKTGEERAIPMTPDLKLSLLALPQRGFWVFTKPPSRSDPAGEVRVNYKWMLRRLKQAAKMFGLEGGLHAFRHGFISDAVLKGIPEAAVQEWAGHVAPETMKIYTHVRDEVSKTLMAKLYDAGRSGDNGTPGDDAAADQAVESDDSTNIAHRKENQT